MARLLGRNCDNILHGSRCGRWIPAFALACPQCSNEDSTPSGRLRQGETILNRMLGFYETNGRGRGNVERANAKNAWRGRS